jgi:hypothetical protein
MNSPLDCVEACVADPGFGAFLPLDQIPDPQPICLRTW